MASHDRSSRSQDAATRSAERLLAGLGAGDPVPSAEYRTLLAGYRRLLSRFQKVMVISDSYNAELKRITQQLDQLRALALPICMFCKKIRVDQNYWQQIETYFARHIDVGFSHGICPDCMRERYGHLVDTEETRKQVTRDIQEIALRGQTRATPETDMAIRAAETLLVSTRISSEELRGGLHVLTDRYRRLLRRMQKILLISDGFQQRLLDMNAGLEILAHTDGLTGLSNRADAMEKLEAERSRAERHGGTFSVIISDVDDFKAINDGWGHEAGDMMLIGLARTFRSILRREDTCARWGGEEFLFLLPETGPAPAATLARKVIDAVRGIALPYGKDVLRCTLSAGVASFRAGATVDHVLREADRALYAAKNDGKDRVASTPAASAKG
jgi:diguanylate cyclase (GGDEF)-like protein